MKKFKFSLDPLLRFKGMSEKNKMKELSIIKAKRKELQRELSLVLGKRASAQEQLKEQLSTGTTITDIKSFQVYIDKLAVKAEEISLAEAEAAKEEELLMEELIALRKEKRMLESLKEKRYQSYLEELKIQEDRKMDELISFKETFAVIRGGDSY